MRLKKKVNAPACRRLEKGKDEWGLEYEIGRQYENLDKFLVMLDRKEGGGNAAVRVS